MPRRLHGRPREVRGVPRDGLERRASNEEGGAGRAVSRERDLTTALVILLYNSAAYIGPCLASVARLDPKPDELVLVDNASCDDSVAQSQTHAARLGLAVTLIRLDRNLGCAGGNNVGWRATKSDVVIFLNPDTEVAPNFVGALVEPLRAVGEVGIVGSKIYYPGTRRLQHAGARVLGNGRTEHDGVGEEDVGQYDEPRECDYVTGAGFAVRRCVLEQLGGFDEDFYPAYFEEVDLCTRAREAGWHVLYWPRAEMVHHESVSLGAESEAFLRLYHRMRLRYCVKHFGARQWWEGFVREEWRTWRRVSPVQRRAMVAAWWAAWKWWMGRVGSRRR